NQTLHAYFAAEGILHQTSIARTPKQNDIVERRNRTLVEAARTMLSAAKVPLFFWAEAIATACFTQNRSLVIPHHEKTPYHIINDRKLSVKFFQIFGSTCYIVRDGENLNKMKEKGDECIFVGYSNQSRAYRVFNKRTRVIMESIHVNFDELTQMALDQLSSDPAHEYRTVTTSNELDLLFSPMFDELLNGSSKVVSKPFAVSAADAPYQRQNHTTPLNIHTTPAPTCQAPSLEPTVSSSENINQAETYAENDQVANDEFINIFSTPVQDQGETSSRHEELHQFDRLDVGKKQKVEDQRRSVKLSKNKTSVTACNDSLNAKTLNVKSVCATCDTCVLIDKHDMRVLKSVAKPIKETVALESKKNPRSFTRKLYKRVSKTCSWWYPKFTPSGYKWKPKSGKENVNSNLVEIVLFIIDSRCSKHMTGDLKLLINFVEKFLGTVKFGNDQIAPILGYGDLVQGAVTIKRVYYVEGLNHNLFFVSQFYDADLEVAFKKSTCYIRDLKGNDLLTSSRGTDLYSITLQDTNCPNPICLMAKASSSQAWLWHRRLSHLNFDTINLLSKNDIVVGLPKLKFIKDHLCSSCELGKAKQKYFHTKLTLSSKRRLQLLHMDLYGPMRVASINGKRYVLLIVDDYSRYTWTHFLRSKDETPKVLINFLRIVQRGLQAQVRVNHTFVEAPRTMLSAAKVPLFFWAEAIATACFTQNRSLVIPRHEKTPYHIINDRKPSVKFFHIFGSICYIVRDRKNLDKMKEKGDECIFTMALNHDSFSPVIQHQANVPQADRTVTTSNELDLLFSLMFDELLNVSSKVVSKSSVVSAADAPNQ
nr:retrovirus-related Pol polyprotein from transposon TNT 1-94 [Tanacetum cinerariifolium]